MLVLTRKRGERIIINNNVTIVVLRSTGNVAVLGIDAPRDIIIMREENIDDGGQAPHLEQPA